MSPVREAIDICTSLEAIMTSINDLTNNSWDDIEEDDGFSPVPEGQYALEIQDAQLKQNNKETGYILKIQFQITGPAYGGRTVFVGLNVVHQNDTAEAIGQRQLKALAKACGVGPEVMDDHTLLVGKKCFGWVFVDTWEGNDGDERKDNKVKNFAAPKGKPDGPKDDSGSNGSGDGWGGDADFEYGENASDPF